MCCWKIARYCLLFCCLQLFAGPLAADWDIAQGETAGAVNCLHQVRWWLDLSGDMTAAEVFALEEAHFRPFAELRQPIPSGAGMWGKFMLDEVSPGDDSLRYFYTPLGPYDRFSLFFKNAGLIQSRHGGILVPHRQLPFPDNALALPLYYGEADPPVVLLRFENEKANAAKLEALYLLTPSQEEAMRRVYHEGRRSHDIYLFIFFGVVGALCFFFLLQWGLHREPAARYYCLYLAAVGLFYWRSFESYQHYLRPLFKHLAAQHYTLEVVFSLVSYIAYLKFVQAFLDLREWNPRLSRIMDGCVWIFLAAAPALFAIQAIWGTAAMIAVFTYFRFSFFGLAIFVIWSIWTKSHRPLAIFIFTGSLFLVIGALMTFLDDIFGGYLYKHPSGTWGYYHSPYGWGIPIYDFKIGILLEVGMFSIGLGYKQQLLQREHRTLVARLREVERQARADLSGIAAAPVPKYPFPLETPFARQVVAEIEAHLSDEGFGVQELARALAMSRGQLFRRSKEDFGVSPIKLIHVVRLWEARRLLENEGRSVSEAAYAVGFGSPSYFTKLFKGAFGYLPSGRGGGAKWE
jgi:AraC-like DNA-binding protein